MNKPDFKTLILIFLFLWIQGAAWAQKDTLSFLHITDLHALFNQDGYLPGIIEYRKQKQQDQGEARLREFYQTVPQKTKSNLVIATGDLVDCFEAETKSGKILDLQAEQFAGLLSDCHVPTLLTLGNHDSFSFYWQNDRMHHNQLSVERSRASWIRNIDCFRNGTYYSKVFQVGNATYRFIFLDDIYYLFRPEEKIPIPYVDKPQLYWLKDQLNKSNTDFEIVFMHVPFSDSISRQGTANELYSVLAQNPSVKLILSGHRHKNEVSKFPCGADKTLVQVQTGALFRNEENWRLIRLTEDQIFISVPGKTVNELVIPVR